MSKGKISFDREGLTLLCAALYLRQVSIYRWKLQREFIVRKECADLRADTSSEWHGRLSESIPLDFRVAKRPVIKWRLLLNNQLADSSESFARRRPPPGLLKRASTLKFSDFAFQWYHLHAERCLIALLKPQVPTWLYRDAETPISKRVSCPGADALERIYKTELSQMDEDGNEVLRPPYEREELQFALMVADICEIPEPKKRGRPLGSVKNPDVLARVVECAQEKHREGLTKNKAAGAALEHLGMTVVSARKATGNPLEFVAESERSALNTIAKHI